jgi:cell division septal protein FtsQ
MDRSRRRAARGPGDTERRPGAPAGASASRLPAAAARRGNRRRAAPLRERLPALRQLPGHALGAGARWLRRGAPALLLAAVAAGLLVGGRAAYRFATTSPRFAVEQIEVAGTRTLTPDQVRARIPARPGDNVFRADLGAIAAALEQEPWIAAATVQRRLPRTLVIEVHERVAAAQLDLGERYLADAEGRIFKRADLERGEGAGLPLLTGIARDEVAGEPAAVAARIRHALAAVAAWRAADRPAVQAILVDVRHAVTLQVGEAGEPIAVRLGTADGERLAARLARFDAAWAALPAAERERTRAIHLDHDTRPDHVTVALAR